MAATARKLEAEVVAKTKKDLRVIKGGRDSDVVKKAPPTGKKVPSSGKSKGKVESKSDKGWVGKSDEYRTVLRLPSKLAPRLKKAALKNGSSINEVLKTLIEVWVKQERC